MVTFFNNSRRTAGCITLLMALIVGVAWGRSYFYEDHIWIAFSRQRALALHTAVDHIAFSGEWQEENGTKSVTETGITVIEVRFDPSKCFNWVVHPTEDSLDYDPWGVSHWYWGWDKFGFGQSDYGSLGFRLLAIPYWALVLPASLLSAYLILWKACLLPPSNTESPINA